MTAKKRKKRPYRKGVGAVVFNDDGLVLVARRIDTPGDAWQLPQGGIHADEKPRKAVIREVAEEIGTVNVEIIAKSSRWLHYDLPEALAAKVWGGRYRGQKQRWFALRFTGTDADIDLDATGHPEFEAWRWASLDELPTLAVSFKRRVYEQIVDEFRHLASPDRAARD